MTFRRQQICVFVVSWLAYAMYYLTRKNFSVVKSRLVDDFGMSTTALGTVDTVYLASYAFGQFLCGSLGDRYGAKKVLALGLIGSAACAVAFGLGSSAIVFALAFGLNGICQSAGWPSGVKAMAPWFGEKSRGKIMGVWSTNYQVGGLLATMLAAFLLAKLGWRYAFFVPALAVAFVGMGVFLFLPQKRSKQASQTKSTQGRSEYFELLKSPEIWSLSFSYFGLKLIRYSLLFWLPFYLHRALGYAEDVAGYLSLSMEIGGVFGAIAAGIVADRYFSKNRSRIVLPMLVTLALCLLLYRHIGSWGIVPNFIAMGLVGFFIFGPDTLISGACAQDIGGEKLAGSAAGFINGMGSLGGILQGWITVLVSESLGWNALFYFFVAVAMLSAAAMIPALVMGLRKTKILDTNSHGRLTDAGDVQKAGYL